MDIPVDRWDDAEDIVDGAIDNHMEISDTSQQNQPMHMEETPEESTGITSHLLSVDESGRAASNHTTTSDSLNHLTSSASISERRNEANVESFDFRLPSTQSIDSDPHTPTVPLTIQTDSQRRTSQTPTMDMLVSEGPLTPTNTAGPFIFDGGAGAGSRRSTEDASAQA